MKKLMMIIPLFIMPTLIGCKNKNAYSFTFNSDYCTLDNKSEYPKNPTEEVSLTMKLKEGYEYCAIPDDVVVLIGGKEVKKGEDYTYEVNDKQANIKLTINGDVVITARFSDSDNNFRIDPSKFDEAIGLTGKDMKYVQRANLRGVMSQNMYQLTYFESYVSPTVYNQYVKNIYGKYQTTGEHYIEKAGDKYYRYDRETTSSPWKKEDAQESDFYTPSTVSIKSLTELGNVTYDLIENNYDKESQSYEFKTVDGKYDVVMSFYNNLVTFISYSNYVENAADTLYFETISFTYRTLTPTLPKSKLIATKNQ